VSGCSITAPSSASFGDREFGSAPALIQQGATCRLKTACRNHSTQWTILSTPGAAFYDTRGHSRPAPNEISIVRSHYRSADLLETGTGSMHIPFKQPRRQSKAMRILAILGLMLTLAGCTGERLRQSGNEQRQTMVAI
jgi:hypothetical protein